MLMSNRYVVAVGMSILLFAITFVSFEYVKNLVPAEMAIMYDGTIMAAVSILMVFVPLMSLIKGHTSTVIIISSITFQFMVLVVMYDLLVGVGKKPGIVAIVAFLTELFVLLILDTFMKPPVFITQQEEIR